MWFSQIQEAQRLSDRILPSIIQDIKIILMMSELKVTVFRFVFHLKIAVGGGRIHLLFEIVFLWVFERVELLYFVSFFLMIK